MPTQQRDRERGPAVGMKKEGMKTGGKLLGTHVGEDQCSFFP
jgi:hypothetical protein